MNEIKKESALKKQLLIIANANGDSWFGCILISLFICLLVISVIAITSDHKVSCYYMETTSTQSGLAYKIMSDINWQEDGMAFSSNNENKTLEVIKTLKQCAPAR